MSKRVLGLWNMGEGSFHKLLSPEESKAIIRRALDSQITSFDTAFSYKNADNYLSAILKERNIKRDKIEIITKVMAVPTLEKKFETSLKRLNTEYVDALLLHWPSDNESVFSSLKKLEELKDKKKAIEIGVSNFPIELLKKTANDFDISIHERPLSLLWTKSWKEEKILNLKTIAYSPLAMGLLSKDRNSLEAIEDSRKNLEVYKASNFYPLVEFISQLCDKYSTSRSELALSWLISENPEYIVQGFSNPNQMNSKPISLKEEDIEKLWEYASLIDAETKSDNIFSHSYLPRKIS